MEGAPGTTVNARTCDWQFLEETGFYVTAESLHLGSHPFAVDST